LQSHHILFYLLLLSGKHNLVLFHPFLGHLADLVVVVKLDLLHIDLLARLQHESKGHLIGLMLAYLGQLATDGRDWYDYFNTLLIDVDTLTGISRTLLHHLLELVVEILDLRLVLYRY
jgi:hypothetical protein